MRRGALALVLLGVACARPRTELWLEVSTDLSVPAEIDRVSITVAHGGPSAWPFTTTHDLARDPIALPLTLGFVPDDERDLSLEVRVSALAGTRPVVSRALTTWFLPGETRALPIELVAACRGVACAADETCGPRGACVPVAVDPWSLPRLGAARGASDGGAPEAPRAPPAIVLVDGADTPLRGARSDQPATRSLCPDGAIVTGFDLATDQGLVARLQPRCGRPVVASDGVVTVPAGEPGAGGAVGEGAVAASCPLGQVVVGFEGRSGLLVDQLAFRCAPLAATGVDLARATTLTPVGGSGGSPMPRTECGTGMMANGAIVSQGNWIESFGLACVQLELR
jgi:hypothetical protein